MIKRIFGGQADQIISKIRSLFTEDVKKEFIKQDIKSFPFDAIQNELKGTTKDISLDDDFLGNILLTQKDENIAFSILALLYPNLDYKNGNFHKDHIHATSLFGIDNLKKIKIPEDKHIYFYGSFYNSILNLQLLDANENESKQDKNLKEWVIEESKKQNISIEKFCENHLIPNVLEFENFPDFLKKRKEILLKNLKELINVESELSF